MRLVLDTLPTMRPAMVLLATASLLVGTVSPTLSAQTTNTLDAATAARADEAVAKVIADTGIPSASVALVQHGDIVYLHAYGKARLDPPMAATTEMQYSIGSVSKQFTAALILMLVQDGRMTLDDPAGKYLPQLTRAKEVTVRELLSMTSGYQDFWPEDYVMTTMMVPTTAQHVLDVWGAKPLDFDPGTQWQYSNTNYVIAGRIAEIVGGKPLVEQFRALFGHCHDRRARPGREPFAAERSNGLLPARAGAAACGSAGGHWMDVRGRRAGDVATRSGALEHQHDEPLVDEIGVL